MCEIATLEHARLYVVYGSETLVWKKKEKLRIKSVQINNLRGMLEMRINKMSGDEIRDLCSVRKGVKEFVGEDV